MAESRSYIGRKSRISGKKFEDWISMSCNYYWEAGVAWIEKTPEPVKYLKPYERSGDRREFVACFEKMAQPDFKGALCDGSMIVFEAKHTEKDRISQDVVSEEQKKEFERYEKLNAHCYVIVSLRMTDFYRVPWDVWKKMKSRYGHKYMSAQELEEFRLKQKGTNILFLEGVELHDYQ